MSYTPRVVTTKDGVKYELAVSDVITPPNLQENSKTKGSVSTWMRKQGTDSWVRTENPRFMEVVSFIESSTSDKVDAEAPEIERVAMHESTERMD